jgi:hypothetical protein
MPFSALGRLHDALEDHLVVDVEVRTGTGKKVVVGERFEAEITIMNPSHQQGQPFIVYKDLDCSIEGTEYATLTRADSGWHCLTRELGPGESVTKTVELKAIRTHPLGHERFVTVHLRGYVDPVALLRVAFTREPHSHVRQEVGDNWPESRRGSVVT